MKEIILLKNGEIALKGLNRRSFEDRMLANIRRRLAGIGSFRVWSSQSTTYIVPADEAADMDEAVDRITKVFGIAAYSRACMVDKNFEVICASAAEYLGDKLRAASTFKVDARRSDKSFPLKSPDICRELGGYLLERFPNLSVDVHKPELTVTVEVRDFAAYIHAGQLPGAGGMPVGSGGRAALLLSGGIDSPVAGYMMAKRGLELIAVHFASPPYTSERARQKVVDLARELLPYAGRIALYVVPFTEIQTYIANNGEEEYFTLLMRRAMMRIAERIAKRERCEGLVTGESVGQVASQTLQALGCTDIVTELPVLRPCAGLDKEEIIAIARRIGTFETSILPFEDCCTVFTPKHPRTKPKLRFVEMVEKKLALPEEMLSLAVDDAELVEIAW